MALDIGELTGYLNLDPSRFQKGIGDALGSLKSKDWKKAGAAAGAASAAALAVGFKSGLDLDAAVAQTSAQLGLTEKEAAKVGTVAGDMYSKNLGDSLGAASDAVGSVLGSFEGLRDGSEAELSAATEAAMTFGKVMDVDVGQAAKTAGVMVQSGLADDAVGAFDLLSKASQKVGPEMVEPLLDATNEYSKHFAMLGMTGEQTMTTLADAAAGGEISIDKAGDAIKEFGIRASDLGDTGAQESLEALGLSGEDTANALLQGGEAAQDATQDIADALLGIEDPAKRAELAGGLFGTQIEDMGKDQLPGFLDALSGTTTSLGEVEGATAAMGETMGETGTAKLAKFGRAVQTELIDMMTGAVDWFNQSAGGLDNLVKYVKPAVLALGGFALVIGAVNLGMKAYQAALLIQKGAVAVATAAQWAWNAALTANPIGIVVMAIAGLVAGLALFFTKTETGQAIWTKAWGAIKGAALAVWGWVESTLWPGMLAAWDAISAGAMWLYQNGIKPAWAGIQIAISAVATWITGTLWPALQTAWDAIAGAVMWLWRSVFQPAWTGIKLAIAVVVTAVQLYVDLLVWNFQNVLAPVVMWLWRNVIRPAWNGIKSAIGAVVSWFQNTAWPALQTVISWIGSAFNTMRDWISAAWRFVRSNVIQPVISWFQNTVWPLIDRVIGWIGMSFQGWKLLLQAVWQFVRERVIQPVVSWFQNTVQPAFKRVLGLIGDGFERFKRGLDRVWSFIRENVIQPVVDWFESTIAPKIDTITGNITDAFDTMKTGIQTAWDAVKDAARAPVRFVVEDVYNDTLRSTFNGVADKLNLDNKWRLPKASVGFASGGIMPGYTPGRDVHQFYSPTAGRLDLSGGEPILRPEAGRVLGSGWVHGINAAARGGGVSGVQSFLGEGHQGFAGGGIWGGIKGAVGGTWDWAKDKASTIAEAVTDPSSVLTKLAGAATDLIPGSGMIREMTVQSGKNVASAIGEWMSGKTAPEVGGVGTGGSLSWAAQLARQYGLTMTSGYRPGATTSTGVPSMHGLNRARDFSNSSGPTPEMMQFALAVLRGSNPTELLYTPLGAANMHRSGRQYANTGSTARGHNNHVHVAYKRGGILDAIGGDVGGYEKGTLSASPGWHMVGEAGPELVRFRGGEQVKNARDTQEHLGDNRNVTLNNHFHEVGGEAAEIAALRVQNRIAQSAREAAGL